MAVGFFFIKHTNKLTSGNCKISTGIKAGFFFFIFILNNWFCLGQAVKSEIRFDHLSNKEGLSQNTVRTLLQDSNGFIWIGTEDGLNRFDGYKFKIYGFNSQNKSSNAFNFINVLFEDQKKRIWVGTRSNGLFKYDWDTELFENFLFEQESSDLLLTNSITAITEDNKGNLWIGTENGLIKLNPNDGLYKHFLHDPDNIGSISNNDILSLKMQGNILWIGNRLGGLNKLDIDTEIIIRYGPNSQGPIRLSSKTINSISLDSNSKLWLGTASGVEILDTKNGQVQTLNKFTDIPINSILFDSRNNIWLGSEMSLFLFDSLQDGWTHFYHEPENPKSIKGSRIIDIIEDYSGVIWIGTRFAGINKYDPIKHEFNSIRNDPSTANSIPSNVIRCFWEDSKNRLWIGTPAGLTNFDRHLNIYNTITQIPGNDNSLTHNDVRSIVGDSNDNLWVGTRNGLSYYNTDKLTFKNFKYDPNDQNSLSGNHIRILLEDDENIWIGTHNNGLKKLNKSTFTFTRYFSESMDKSIHDAKRITSLYFDSQGSLWIGTSGHGVFKMTVDEKGNEQFVQYTANDSLNSLTVNIIKSFFEDDKGNFWIATANGFSKMDREKETFRTYLPEDGLANKMVYGIVQDEDGYLWMSTNNGLSRFNINSEKFRNFYEHNGLQANEFNTNAFIKTADGMIIFGGINGINLFNPKEIKEYRFVPEVLIVDFQLFYKSQNPESGGILDKHVSALKEINLTYDQNVFSFEFILIDYTNPEKNQYKYILEGFDSQWINSNNRNFATYTNLASGDYTFKVIGSNSDGIWNEEPAVMNISISPPWWKTWWFLISFWLAIISIAVGFIWNREQALKRKTDMHKKLLRLKYALERIIKIKEDVADVNNWDSINQQVVRLISDALKVELVGIWTLSNNGNFIIAETIYKKSENTFEKGKLLKKENYPSFFKHLHNEVNITANDVATHPATLELTETYLNSLNIKSMMVFPIKIQGKIRAIICCQHVGASRIWELQEQNFITAIASTLALNIETSQRIKSDIESTIKANELEQLIDMANGPIFGIDQDGNVNEWNKATERITGVTKKDAMGKKFIEEFITSDYRHSVKEVMDKALKGKETANYEFPLFNRKGKRIMILLNASTRKKLNGSVIGVLVVGQDITELIDHKDKLEQKVVDRTNELNEALSKEKELGVLKSRFVAMASHEFRTPLTAILTASDIIKRYQDRMTKTEVIVKIDKIQTEIKSLTDILEDFLIMGKSEDGKIEFKTEKMNFKFFCDDFISEMKSIAEKDHNFDYVFENPEVAELDPRLIKHIISNLLSNAIKYSDAGSKIEFHVSAKNGLIKMQFNDNGIGIPKDDLKNIFDSFHRASNVGSVSGTGLGMAIVKKSVDLHNGQITINSTEGVGTKIEVTIPYK